MQSRKSLFGLLLGGIGAITGIGLFASGCNDDSGKQITQEVTSQMIEQCCGTDKTSQEYAACVQAYQTNGVCSSPILKPDDPLPDVPLYGMPDPVPPTAEQIQECCGYDNGSKAYKECVENYIDVNNKPKCSHSEPIAIYGPDPTWCCGPKWNDCSDIYFHGGDCTSGIDPSESEACCAQTEDPGACVLDFIKSKGVCSYIDNPPQPVYGMPDDPPIDEPVSVWDCCEMNNGHEDEICVQDYEQTGTCHNEDLKECCTDTKDSYKSYKGFNHVCVSMLRKNNQCSAELKDCCGLEDGTYDDECTELFDKSGKCPTELITCCKNTKGVIDPYCANRVEKKGACDQEFNTCCQNDEGEIDELCAHTYDKYHVCAKDVDTCCKDSANDNSRYICRHSMYYAQLCNDEDMLNCCTERDSNGYPLSWSYTCINYYKKVNQYNVCADADDVNGGPVTIYGGDFRPLPFEWCDDYKGDYKKCIDFARCDVKLQEEEAKQCCGEDDKAEGYSDCLNTYKEKGKSESCLQPLDEGEPAPNTNPIACCGKGYTETSDYTGKGDVGETPWEKCVQAYLKDGKCPDKPGE